MIASIRKDSTAKNKHSYFFSTSIVDVESEWIRKKERKTKYEIVQHSKVVWVKEIKYARKKQNIIHWDRCSRYHCMAREAIGHEKKAKRKYGKSDGKKIKYIKYTNISLNCYSAAELWLKPDSMCRSKKKTRERAHSLHTLNVIYLSTCEIGRFI